MYDPKAIIATTDLTVIVETDLGAPEKGGRWWCPFCQTSSRHTPALSVKREFFYCFGCGKGGDVFEWLKEYRKLEFVDACKLLTGGRGVMAMTTARPGAAGRDPVKSTTSTKPKPDFLQDAWKEIIDECQKTLWSDRGKAARDYLHRERLLTDETLQSPFHRVGFSEGRKIAGLWVDRGVVLPCFTVKDDLSIDYVDYVKLRRGKAWLYHPEDGSKYRKLSGHGADLSGLYGAVNCEGASEIVMTEGEFDALVLHQAAGNLVGVATLGGAQDHFNWGRFGQYLISVRTLFVAYDNDKAGDRGSDFWSSMTGRAVRVRVPDGHKDITDYARAGGDLVAWVTQAFIDHNLLTGHLVGRGVL